MNNLEMSDKAKPLLAAVIKHICDNVDPISKEYFALGEGRADRWR
ncbi:MAG TPA: acyl-CoA dehydrogenase, partial [Rhodobacteraceae bacterium]|nr:acyl-CoA dehydrogenase [Paracoccaceae bacterium]